MIMKDLIQGEISTTVKLVWAGDVGFAINCIVPTGVGYLVGYLVDKGIKVKVLDCTFPETIEFEKTKSIYGISFSTMSYR